MPIGLSKYVLVLWSNGTGFFISPDSLSGEVRLSYGEQTPTFLVPCHEGQELFILTRLGRIIRIVQRRDNTVYELKVTAFKLVNLIDPDWVTDVCVV